MSSESQQGVSIGDKVVLVTGANRGIGKAIVEALVEGGASKVYAAVRTLSTAQPLVDKFPNGRIEPIYMDMSKPESIADAAEVAKDVHIVINNAGILSRTFALSTDAVARLEEEMQVNVHGLMHVAQQFAPILKRNGGGAFVQLNSVASLRCLMPSVSTYSASKAAAFSVTQALRKQFQEQGTLVVSVHPGPIATDMIQGSEIAKLPTESPEACAKEIIVAIQGGTFLCFPDPRSKSLGQAYQGFSEYVFGQGNSY